MRFLAVSVVEGFIGTTLLKQNGGIVDIKAGFFLSGHDIRVFVAKGEVWLSNGTHQMLSGLMFGIS